MRMPKMLLKVTAWLLGGVAGLLILVFLAVSVLIGWGVESTSRKAMAKFSGDRIEALIACVDCRGCDLRERESAVWALGQLTDKRALPVLYKYRTGKSCNHWTTICQYEISKAIRWTEGNSYMLPQVWRAMLWWDDYHSAPEARS